MHTPNLIGWYIFSGGIQINYPVKNLWPSCYLDFAKEDFEQEKSQRTFVNTVSNAKRALHYQVDALANAFGWEIIKGKRDFPTKLEFLGKCGVLSPTIIKRMNRLRNSVEHDYYIPTEEETLDYLEIVELYLGATHHTATYFPNCVEAELISSDDEYNPEWKYPEVLKIHLPEATGRLKICAKDQIIFEAIVGEQEYFDWVSMIVKQNAA